jgi:mannose-1-phosphate guanylyltransferase
MERKNLYCVIMAGGIGSRFWPMSRTDLPKQFHDVLGTGNTLIQQTFERFLAICPRENIYVVTSDIYKSLVSEQLDGIPEENILLEPSRRNTAPCLAYASHKILKRNKNGVMIVAPSDHLVLKENEFKKTIDVAVHQAVETGHLVTLGIKPSRPDTGYGYIQFEDEPGGSDQVKKVKTFTEKPDLDLAREFLRSGDFYWNSGIFIWTVGSIIEAFENHLSDINSLFNGIQQKLGTSEEASAIEGVYSVCESISIDYGILEKAKNVDVVLSNFGWSDLGTWGSLFTQVKKDKENNALIGKNIILQESSDNIIKVGDQKLAVIRGLEDYIVIDTSDALLIYPKEEEQKIKQVVNDLKLSKNAKYV